VGAIASYEGHSGFLRWWPKALPATQRVQPREPNGDARPAAASADQTVRP
jgi:hypothetical protein